MEVSMPNLARWMDVEHQGSATQSAWHRLASEKAGVKLHGGRDPLGLLRVEIYPLMQGRLGGVDHGRNAVLGVPEVTTGFFAYSVDVVAGLAEPVPRSAVARRLGIVARGPVCRQVEGAVHPFSPPSQ